MSLHVVSLPSQCLCGAKHTEALQSALPLLRWVDTVFAGEALPCSRCIRVILAYPSLALLLSRSQRIRLRSYLHFRTGEE